MSHALLPDKDADAAVDFTIDCVVEGVNVLAVSARDSCAGSDPVEPTSGMAMHRPERKEQDILVWFRRRTSQTTALWPFKLQARHSSHP